MEIKLNPQSSSSMVMSSRSQYSKLFMEVKLNPSRAQAPRLGAQAPRLGAQAPILKIVHGVVMSKHYAAQALNKLELKLWRMKSFNSSFI
jgi:hypothetical protein